MKDIRARSDLVGWQYKFRELRKVYCCYEEFLQYNEIYNIAERLGFQSASEAWIENPMIKGSVTTGD